MEIPQDTASSPSTQRGHGPVCGWLSQLNLVLKSPSCSGHLIKGVSRSPQCLAIRDFPAEVSHTVKSHGAETNHPHCAFSKSLTPRVPKHDQIALILYIEFGRVYYTAIDHRNTHLRMHWTLRMCAGDPAIVSVFQTRHREGEMEKQDTLIPLEGKKKNPAHFSLVTPLSYALALLQGRLGNVVFKVNNYILS